MNLYERRMDRPYEDYENAEWARATIANFKPKNRQLRTTARWYVAFGIMLSVLTLVALLISPIISVIAVFCAILAFHKAYIDFDTVQMAEHELWIKQNIVDEYYFPIDEDDDDEVDTL